MVSIFVSFKKIIWKFSKQNINSHETPFNLKIAVNPVDGHIGPILTSVLRLTMFLSRKWKQKFRILLRCLELLEKINDDLWKKD